MRFEYEHGLTAHVLVIGRPLLLRSVPSADRQPASTDQRANTQIDDVAREQVVPNEKAAVAEPHAVIGIVRLGSVLLVRIDRARDAAPSATQLENVIDDHATLTADLGTATTSKPCVHHANAAETTDRVVARHLEQSGRAVIRALRFGARFAVLRSRGRRAFWSVWRGSHR